MHRAWDHLLWGLLFAVALATGLAIGATLPGEDSEEGLIFGRALPLGLAILAFAVVGIVVSLESSERGRLSRLASLVRIAIVIGGVAGTLALLLGASRTSPLAHTALLAGTFAACGLLAILLDRLRLEAAWAQVLRRVALLVGWLGVLLPAVVVFCLGVATWAVAMLARGEPPLADEGALPLAERLVRSAAFLWAFLVLPLSLLAVAGRVLVAPRCERSAPGLLAVSMACPRCGDRRTRPFGCEWTCAGCGLAVSVDAPEMNCDCGTPLVGVSGERCPSCASAIRTRWGGPAASLEPHAPAEPLDGVLGRRARTLGWLLLAAVPPMVIFGSQPIEVVRVHLTRLDAITIEGLMVCTIWGCLLVAMHALLRGRLVWLAIVALLASAGVALVSAPASSLLLTPPVAATAMALTWIMALAGTGSLAMLRLRAASRAEQRVRVVTLLVLAAVVALVLLAGWRPSAPLATQTAWPLAILSLGTGLALIIVRRLGRRRQLRPEHFGLARDAVLPLSCPRCTALLRVPLSAALLRCEGCDLLVHVALCGEGDRDPPARGGEPEGPGSKAGEAIAAASL